VTISGVVSYERLVLTLGGLGPAAETRLARHVDVEIRSASSGACYGRGSTDAGGSYSLTVMPPAGESIEVVAFSRTLEAPNHDIFVHEALPPFSNTHAETNVFSYASAPFTATSQVINFRVPYYSGPANRPAIGFGLLDILVTCWDGLMAANAKPPERAHAYTLLGNNASLQNTSFYDHSVRSMALLGGAAGLPDDSDTDYFDDGVVAHEFMHFVDKLISHSMSRGGPHSGSLIEPNFSWGEGMATGFGCLLMGSPHYMDSRRTDASKPQTIAFYTNAENSLSVDPPGIGGEFTVAEVVWDCGDGALDADTDGINAPMSELFTALKSFDPATDGPYIGLFLTRLVAAAASMSTPGMADFLVNGPEDQQISFPPVGDDVWPKPITVGGVTAAGELTSVGDPFPCRGLFSSHWYQFTLAAPAVVSINLTVIGLPGTADNLDMYLSSNLNVNLTAASSTNAGDADESITVSLGAGTFILRVEAQCGGAGDRAQYVLEID